MNLNTLLAVTCLVGLQFASQAQDKSNVKYGKIATEDFDLSKNKYDSSSAAVVIADIGSSEFEGNYKGWFSLLYKHFKRIKVLTKKGFDLATISIPLYFDGTDQEKLENLKAVTYNVEGGKVVETKVDDKSVFTDKISKNRMVKKFTFPNVKEGSIIEYSYTILSDFLFNLQPWTFQSDIPCFWSEYQVTLPEFFNYVFLAQGFQPYFVNTSTNGFAHFVVKEPGGTQSDRIIDVDGGAVTRRWVMKDVPAFLEERYTSAVGNYVSKIEFQLSQYRFPNSPVEDILKTWPKVSEKMMQAESFGGDFANNNGWMDNDLKGVTGSSSDKLEIASKIYAYVRDNYTCTSHSYLYADNPIKTVFKNKSGSEAEINLLLTAMLIHENIQADPLILSTREKGWTHEIYPLLDRYNYVISTANIAGQIYYLDASHRLLAFGALPEECYNGHAVIINKENPLPVYLLPDSLKEIKLSAVIISNNEKGGGLMDGTFTTTLGKMQSYSFRDELSKKTIESYVKSLKAEQSDYDITNPGIDSLNQLDKPIKIHYDFSFKITPDAETIYFAPMMGEGQKDNPFKAAERKYPVEMPYVSDEIYVLTMEIPNGYMIEEVPQSARVSLNESEGAFEYLIAKDETQIQLRARLKLNKATFEPDDYNTLRGFFAFVVKKESEQIVFKKKK